MCIVTLNNYITGENSGGTWTQIVNPGNSIVAIVNGSINTDNINTGIYTFAYTVTNGTCTDTSTLTITVIPGGELSTNTYCFTDATPTVYNIFTLSGVTSATHTLAYQAGSQQDVNINLVTGDYLATEVEMGIYTIELIPIDPIIDECNCIRTHTIYSVGCVDVTLDVNNCEVSWSPTCIQANTIPVVYTLQEFVNNTWVNLTTVSPYIVPSGESKTLRLEAAASPCIPIYSPQVTVFCDPNMCTTCNLEWSSFQQNAIGRLAVGVVQSYSSPQCTVGNYVIDWYLNSVSTPNKVFTTGVGSDPDIEVLHPFLNNQAIPVIGGVYIPIIRYIYLNGILYAPTTYPGALVSPSLSECLVSITVQDYACNNGIPPTSPPASAFNYVHTIEYTANTNFANATRSIRFNYTPGTDIYLAYRFIGYLVADRLQFVHVLNGVQTILLDIVVGNDNTSTNLSGPIKFIDRSLESNILELPTATGSYLLLNITPSYNQPLNQNTSWELFLRCLTTFDCNEIVINPQVQCSTNGCNTSVQGIVSINPYLFFLNESTQASSIATINSSTFCPSGTIHGTNYTCFNTPNTTITKSGNSWLVQFGNASAFNAYKDTYDAILTTLNNTNCSNPSLPSYYNIMHFAFNGGGNCGDATVVQYYSFHYCTSTFTWNSINNTLSINTSGPITMQYVPTGPCDICDESIQIEINAINATANLPNFSSVVSTKVQGYVINASNFSNTPEQLASFNGLQKCRIFSSTTPELFPIPNCLCFAEPYICVRLTVTNLASPCDNYIFEYKAFNPTTGCSNGAWTVLLESP